jgi:DNA-binding MarR family transcriptional regulator
MNKGYTGHNPQTIKLSELLLQVCRLVGDRLRVKMEGIGLHKGQGCILFCLWQHDGIPQHVIAQALHVSSATVTNMLKRMERDGWITRERDKKDRRVVLVRLTQKAKELHKQVQASFYSLEEELTAGLTEDQQRVLGDVLVKIHGQLAPETVEDEIDS